MSETAKGNGSIPFTDNFADVLGKEYETIAARRAAANINVAARRKPAGKKVVNGERSKMEAPPELFGLALSGGGIRSASFCLGALQALDQYKLIPRLDYLSTVSGGGYIGASMVAGMTGNKGVFPFTAGAEKDVADVHDSELVSHLRDNSRFLAPKKAKDLLISFVIFLRGLIVNFLMILAIIFPLASLLIAMNPTVEHLDHNVILDLFNFLLPSGFEGNRYIIRAQAILAHPFLLSMISAIVLLLFLIGWALRRSYVESYSPDKASVVVEPESFGATTGWKLFVTLMLAFAVELQPIVVGWLIEVLQEPPVTQAGLGYFGALLTGVAAATAAFRERLVAWVQKALSSPTLGARIQSLLARTAFYAAALAVPLIIYGLFLILAVWGIDVGPGAEAAYPFAPTWLVADSWGLALVLAAGVVLYVFFVAPRLVADFRGRARILLGVVLRRHYVAVIMITLWIVLIIFAAVATHSNGDSRQWTVLTNYLLISLYVGAIAVNFTENANGLHRLYRDRLSSAFRLGRDASGNPLRLHELDDKNPYLLINGALNVRFASDRPNLDGSSTVPIDPRSDPAKRGRNAEFFVFSRHFVGSDATGYADAEALAGIEPQLDLATATAISGAAVSSSMGRVSVGLLGPTLALLNLRLGFWLRNPRFISEWEATPGGVRQLANLSERKWEDIMRFYLFAEAFGRMRSDSSRIYITDGGHIDNLGLYQLLKRKCKLIVVVDAEADAGFNFGAFCDVQRFARIDQGVRISLDWRPVREAALTRAADRLKTAPEDSDVHRRHFAVGRIKYEDEPDEDGILLYVKASVTGDEADYVLDYERRYPLFPHESTGDQFFSEEQMEAYRALGFHAMRVALQEQAPTPPTRAPLEPKVPAAGDVVPSEPPITTLKRRLGVEGVSIC